MCPLRMRPIASWWTIFDVCNTIMSTNRCSTSNCAIGSNGWSSIWTTVAKIFNGIWWAIFRWSFIQEIRNLLGLFVLLIVDAHRCASRPMRGRKAPELFGGKWGGLVSEGNEGFRSCIRWTEAAEHIHRRLGTHTTFLCEFTEGDFCLLQTNCANWMQKSMAHRRTFSGCGPRWPSGMRRPKMVRRLMRLWSRWRSMMIKSRR